MPIRNSRVLQIVPQLPGTLDGVGDYALNLAKALSAHCGLVTVFGVARKTTVTEKNGFAVISGLDHAIDSQTHEWDHVILHYVNYGYHPRGVPFWLLAFLKESRRKWSGALLTVFHELYASEPPWKSAFWLQPWQKQIAREISRISDRRIVSNPPVLEQLRRLDPDCAVSLQPIPSSFGEPILTPEEMNRRNPHRWAICGGSALLQRGLHSFLSVRGLIPESSRPRELFVLGGKDDSVVRSLLQNARDLKITYRPETSVASASEILSTCSFGWIDYFRQRAVPTGAILKSTSFAAYCAHGVVPVFPHPGSAISISDDYLPGPYFVSRDRIELPEDREKTAAKIYEWYRGHVALEHLVRGVIAALDLTAECK